jgi:hypothetical protein
MDAAKCGSMEDAWKVFNKNIALTRKEMFLT